MTVSSSRDIPGNPLHCTGVVHRCAGILGTLLLFASVLGFFFLVFFYFFSFALFTFVTRHPSFGASALFLFVLFFSFFLPFLPLFALFALL